MGLTRSKFFRLFLILPLMIVGLQIGADTSNSQEVRKEVEGPGVYEPGDPVDINIRVPGANDQLRDPADIMLVMDRSGSMTAGTFLGTTKIEAAIDAMLVFVNETTEAGPGIPGDYVGLATYSTSSTLDYPIANMTEANKTELKNEIKSICFEPDEEVEPGDTVDPDAPGKYDCGGGTSIGSGLDIANKELTDIIEPASSVRSGVPKFIVIATDGRHNFPPSPYSSGIMDEIISKDIVVFTVGIGNDVITIGPFDDCVGCPDPNGDGLTSGEELMKTIACDTDPDCTKMWDMGNDPSINDYDNPHNYFFANDPDSLSQVYEDIIGLIQEPTAYGIIDSINTDIFTQIQPGSLTANTITNCATGEVWPTTEVQVFSSAFFIILEPVPDGTDVCIRFTAILKDPVAPQYLDSPQPVNQVGIAASVDEDFDCSGFSFFIQCILAVSQFPRVDIQNAFIIIENPFDPWLQTTDGDVGSLGPIQHIARDPLIPSPGGIYNADYLTIGQSTIHDNFRTRRWKIQNYFPLNFDPQPVSGSIYTALLNQNTPDQDINTDSYNQVVNAINGGSRVIRVKSDLTIAGGVVNYSSNPAIIFVSGSLNMNTQEFRVADNTGVIFVVNKNVIIHPNNRRSDGFYVANGTFNSVRGRSCSAGSGSNDNPLVINGAVHVFGQPCFTRGLADNELTPAEQINYEPKYLFLFPDVVSNSQVIYREVAP